MNLAELELAVYRDTGHPDQPDAEVRARIDYYLNQAQRSIFADKRWGHKLRRQVLPVSSIADVEFLSMPLAVQKIIHLVDRTDDHALEPKTLDWLRQVDPALTASTANPWAWIPHSAYSPVVRQPSDASQVFLKSDSASDTQKVTIEFINSSGHQLREVLTLNGTTAVSTTSTAVTHLLKVQLSAAATGTVTVHEDSSSGTELGRILPNSASSRHLTIQLYPTPTESRTYYVDAEVRVVDMVSLTDEPALPEDFHQLLVLRAIIAEWRKRDQGKLANTYGGDIIRLERQLTSFLRSGDPNSSDTARRSQLGPWFPAGT